MLSDQASGADIPCVPDGSTQTDHRSLGNGNIFPYIDEYWRAGASQLGYGRDFRAAKPAVSQLSQKDR